MSTWFVTDELTHYGVRGMKWGVRKEPVSMAGRFHRLAAANYNLNARTYSRIGNKTLASMNKAAANNSLKKAQAADAAKKAKIKKKAGQKAASQPLNISGKAVGKTLKANEAVERKKSQVASKLGAKGHAQKYKNNADYYKKTANDLASGKVGKPKTNYQKAMRWLGKTNFATHAIVTSKHMNKQQKAQALVEQHQMRKADGWYKKRAKTLATIKVANLAVGAALSK